MLTLRRFDDWHLLVVTYTEPFSGADLIFAANASAKAELEKKKHICALVDLRAVDISKLTGSDSRRFGFARKARLSGEQAEPVAFLLRDMDQFGMLRMHNQWVEAVGLRDEKDTFVSTEPRAALGWLEDQTSQPGLADTVMAHLERSEDDPRRLTGDST